MSFNVPIKIHLVNAYAKLVPAKFGFSRFGMTHSNSAQFSKGGVPPVRYPLLNNSVI